MIVITEKPLVPEEFISKISGKHNGALAVFMGTVRDFVGDTRLAYMEYDAYKEMAEKKLAEIVKEAEARWETRDIAVAHRIGRLELKEISVIVAVGTPHRAEAFEACRFIIDNIKERVPIWKKEIDEQGRGEWVEGCVPSVKEPAPG
ncbi:MAG: molybdenum cofactor biosynthesis protein MoaE [Chloroflexi bacterium]|nr:molybdenum cofactor biosynthesis protein MoaE [Chloroflexota bacterium]